MYVAWAHLPPCEALTIAGIERFGWVELMIIGVTSQLWLVAKRHGVLCI